MLNDILQHINKYDVISFDIFDTLIVRDVDNPADVFKLMEIELNIPGFAEKRVNAEILARKKNVKNEVTINDIYLSFEGLTSNLVAKCIKIELQMEIELCHPNLELIEFYKQCLKQYRVIITSDMYLPHDMMKEILDSCGITNYEQLYISCDVGLAKGGRGDLYKYISDNLGVDTKYITHIITHS